MMCHTRGTAGWCRVFHFLLPANIRKSLRPGIDSLYTVSAKAVSTLTHTSETTLGGQLLIPGAEAYAELNRRQPQRPLNQLGTPSTLEIPLLNSFPVIYGQNRCALEGALIAFQRISSRCVAPQRPRGFPVPRTANRSFLHETCTKEIQPLGIKEPLFVHFRIRD